MSWAALAGGMAGVATLLLPGATVYLGAWTVMSVLLA